VLLDGSLELFLGYLFVTVGVNLLEGVGDILSPSGSELDSVFLGETSNGSGDLLKAPFAIIVGVDGVEDSGLPALWELVVVGSGESLDGSVDFLDGKGIVTVGVDFLEHLIEWHLGLNTKSDEGVGWGDSPPGSGGGGDEGSNSKGEFHFEVEVVVCFLII